MLIEWNITNLTSGNKLSRIETPDEAYVRNNHGNTICNNVVKCAFEQRAKELEEFIECVHNNTSNFMHRRLKQLRSKRCIIGLLFFGLQDKIVQDCLKAQMLTSNNPASIPCHALSSNRKTEQATIAATVMRYATEYHPDGITIGLLKIHTFSYAWEKFELNHPIALKDSEQVTVVQEQLPFMQFQIMQPSIQENGVSMHNPPIYSWTCLSQLETFELIEDFSFPSTPHSLDHFFDVWKHFTDIVLIQVEHRLRVFV